MTSLGIDDGVLRGIKVLDLSRVIAGPLVGQILGDLGADVIKVERPTIGDDSRAYTGGRKGVISPVFASLNRNKRSIVIDLKSERGRATLCTMAEQADVLIHNFRPGVMERLKLDYQTLQPLAPQLVYCAISGFGDDTARRQYAANDLIAQAYGGAMSITGEENGEPVRSGASIADMTAGLYATIGVLAALIERTRSGAGQSVKSSLVEGQFGLMCYQFADYWMTGNVPRRMGSANTLGLPNQAFPTRDGWVVIAATGERMWRNCCIALGFPESADDPRFSGLQNRYADRKEVIELVSSATRQLTRAECLRKLEGKGVSCAPINGIDEIAEDAMVTESGIAIECEGWDGRIMKLVGLPVRLSRSPVQLRSAPPSLGGSTGEVLVEWGFAETEIEELRACGAIASAG